MPQRAARGIAPSAHGPPQLPDVDTQIEAMQSQIEALSTEIEALRRRDETVRFIMHRIDEELRLAARLQQDFLPKTLPQVGSMCFHTLFRPAGYVSGDLYDVMRLDERHVAFYMADAVGHGMPAALLTMFIRNALVTKQIMPNGYRLLPPSETMSRLNDALVGQDLSYATFATAIYGVVNADRHEVSFARGGHPNPVVLRRDGSIQTVECDGGLLGIFPQETFATATVCLDPGDRLFVFSDGLEIAFSGEHNQNTNRWKQELQSRGCLGTDKLLTELALQLDLETGSLSPKDDLTILVVEVR